MRIQYLSDGLGNQILQYVFARYIERRSPQYPVFFDDVFFFLENPVPHNGFELESVFGLHLNLLSRYFDADTWDKFLYLKQKGLFLPQILLEAGIPIAVVTQTRCSCFSRGIAITKEQITPEIWDLPFQNIYYNDWWFDDYWFEQDREANLSELTFPELKDEKNLKYAEEMEGCFSVGIHVRRGTFPSNGWAVSNQEYLLACRKILDQNPDARFFIFSDEPDWCMENAAELGFDLASHVVYVEGNNQGRNYIDMQLLSMCDGIVRPGLSTFSQIAARLNRNLKFDVILGETIMERNQITPMSSV